MVRFISSATAAYGLTTLLLTSCAHAAPVINPVANDLLGFDPTAVRPSQADDIIPQYINLNMTDLNPRSSTTADAQEYPQTEPNNMTEPLPDESLAKRYIVGKDNRYQYTNLSYPFSITGRLTWSNGVICSASLVGPRHVLTAKHCLPTTPIPGTFTPAYDNGTAPFGSFPITHTISTGPAWGTPCGWKLDWAILILPSSARPGDILGWFGAKTPSPSIKGSKHYTHVGYPSDRDGAQRPYRTDVNRVLRDRGFDCDATGPYYTVTDCASGQSGGPHWKRDRANGGMYVFGTLSVTLVDGLGAASGWAGGVEMVRGIGDARREYP